MRPVAILSDSALIRPLLSGLPLRFHFQVELWQDRFPFDDLADRASWSLILLHEPLSGEYNLTRSWDPEHSEWFGTLEAATRALERWYVVPIDAPRTDARYYYDARLEVEILSLGDLAELEHWLRGEVVDDDDVGTAVGRGLKRLFIRLIGLSARKYSARTELFRPE